MNLEASTRSAGPFAPARHAIATAELAIRHLRTRAEIEEILHLREGIDLSVHAAGSNFLADEKKEMSAASLAHSNFMVKS